MLDAGEGIGDNVLALIEISRKLQFGLVTRVVALIAYLIIVVTGLDLGFARSSTA